MDEKKLEKLLGIYEEIGLLLNENEHSEDWKVPSCGKGLKIVYETADHESVAIGTECSYLEVARNYIGTILLAHGLLENTEQEVGVDYHQGIKTQFVSPVRLNDGISMVNIVCAYITDNHSDSWDLSKVFTKYWN